MSHLTERYSSLTHAPGAGVEAQKKESLGSSEILVKVLEVGVLTVVQGIENIFHFRVREVNVDNVLS